MVSVVHMILDCHTHVDSGCKGTITNKTVDELLGEMDKCGVEKSVVLVIAPKGDLAGTKRQNDWLAETCRNSRRLIGFCSAHPDDGEGALHEIERCAKTLGLKGIKLHPVVQAFDSAHPFLNQIFELAAALDLPVIIDTFAPLDDAQPGKLLKLVTSNLKTKVILSHVGLTRFQDFAIYPMMKKRNPDAMKNVYFDLSAVCLSFYRSPYQEHLRWLCEQMGTDRLLFGSDYPLYPYKDNLEAISNFGFEQDALPNILGLNCKRLLGS